MSRERIGRACDTQEMRVSVRGDQDGCPRRLWVEFEPPPSLERQPVGYWGEPRPRIFGVTGLDSADCWDIVREVVGNELPQVRVAVWDVDISTLDPRLIPTGNPATRGIWYAGTGLR